MSYKMEIIGLIPAGGFGTRIAPLPCSKEIFPLGFQYSAKNKEIRPKVACHYLLEKMAKANANKAYVILRPEKWDIPLYLRNGKGIGINIAYLITDPNSGTPYTVDHAYHFIENALILFGFPDIIFGPNDAFVRLMDRYNACGADIVLGLYRAHQPQKMDMVRLNRAGRIVEIVIKPCSTDLEYTWITAVWTSRFTHFMHTYLSGFSINQVGKRKELYIGDVIQAGLKEGISVETVIFDNETYVDIGTPEDLIKAVKKYANTGGF